MSMLPHQKVFHDELNFLLEQLKTGQVKSIHELMKLLDMAYSDYLEFHPEEIPEYNEYRKRTGKLTESSS